MINKLEQVTGLTIWELWFAALMSGIGMVLFAAMYCFCAMLFAAVGGV